MKKNMLAILIAALLAFAITGCGGEGLKQIESDFTITVTGSPGTAFKGDYTFPDSSGIRRPVHVSGTVPARYSGRAVTVICVFRKTDAAGTLKVEILKNNVLAGSKETSEPFGVITMGKLPNQEGLLNLLIGRILDLLGS